MPSYKLTYFQGRGRAEITRLIFAQAGVKYEDNRITGDDWKTLKPTTPWGGMPILEVDGKVIAQSLTIARYVAKQTGLAGKNPLENALIDSVVDATGDIVTAVVAAMFEKDETKKAELQKKFMEETLPKVLGNLEKFLSNNKGGFFVGDSVTWADLYVFDVLSGVVERSEKPDLLSKQGFSNLEAFCKRVGELPKIKAWVESRPKTNF